jgi:hypothetical protein
VEGVVAAAAAMVVPEEDAPAVAVAGAALPEADQRVRTRQFNA